MGPSRSRHGNLARHSGFTLIELLVVMVIMILIMGTALAGWFGIRRGAEMRRSVSTVQTSLMLARQQAVTKRQTVKVTFDTARNSLKINTNLLYYTEMYLSPGVRFSSAPSEVKFKPNGSAEGGDTLGKVTISLVESVSQGGAVASADIDLWLLTGTTRVR